MGFLTEVATVLSERRLHPSQDGDWGAIFGRGLETNAGVDVSVDGALGLPAVWACVNVLAQTIGMLPLLTYERQGEARKSRAESHPLYMLLKEEPNGEQTAMEFREMVTAFVASWGNGYAEIDWSPSGQVRGLWPLLPNKMLGMRRRNGRLQYLYQLPDGQEVTLPGYRVLHLRGLSGDGMMGYSPVRVAMQAIGLGLATEEFGARFFSNGARPGFVLRHPQALKDEAYKRLKASWSEDHQGLSNAHRVKILEEGMEVQTVGIPPEEAQFLETRKFQAEEIARFYRMPPHKIGVMDKATFSNIEHQGIEFLTDTIMPWLVRFEQKYQQALMVGEEKRRLYVEHLVEGLLRGDTKTRFDAYAVGRNWGWLSINDIRVRENMDPIENGDDYLQPLNMQVVGAPAPDQAGDDAGADNVVRAWFDEAAQRAVRREVADLRRALPKIRTQGVEGFQTWAQDFYRELTPAIVETLGPAVRAAADVMRAEVDVQKRLEDAAAGYVMRHHAQVVGLAAQEDGQTALETQLAAWEQAAAGDLVSGLGR